MDWVHIIVPVAIGWGVLSVVVAGLWALLRSRLPHPDEFLDDDTGFEEETERPRSGRDLV